MFRANNFERSPSSESVYTCAKEILDNKLYAQAIKSLPKTQVVLKIGPSSRGPLGVPKHLCLS